MARRKPLTKREIKYIIGFILAALGAYTITGDSRIIDGDTVKIGTERIRLKGIDAPETSQSCRCNGKKVMCGQQATQALIDYVGKNEISCVAKERDNYGRLIGECFIERDGIKINLNQWMVRNGHAVAYAQYSRQFVADENAAKDEGKGIWACHFQMPWEYRKAEREKRHRR